MERSKLSSINSFHTKPRYLYGSIKGLIPGSLIAAGSLFKSIWCLPAFLPSITTPIKLYIFFGLIIHPIVATATSRSCYHLISSSKTGARKGAKAVASIWFHKSNMKLHSTPKSASCPCCNVCCDRSFILLVRKNMLFIRASKTYLHMFKDSAIVLMK